VLAVSILFGTLPWIISIDCPGDDYSGMGGLFNPRLIVRCAGDSHFGGVNILICTRIQCCRQPLQSLAGYGPAG
jgi:hypothetical protein